MRLNSDYSKHEDIAAIVNQRSAGGTLSLLQASTTDVSAACETQMPDRESAFRQVPAQPMTEDRNGFLSDGAPLPERKVVEGRVGFIGLGRMGIAMATNLARS